MEKQRSGVSKLSGGVVTVLYRVLLLICDWNVGPAECTVMRARVGTKLVAEGNHNFVLSRQFFKHIMQVNFVFYYYYLYMDRFDLHHSKHLQH